MRRVVKRLPSFAQYRIGDRRRAGKADPDLRLGVRALGARTKQDAPITDESSQ